MSTAVLLHNICERVPVEYRSLKSNNEIQTLLLINYARFCEIVRVVAKH